MRLYRSLVFLELTENGKIRELKPSCNVEVPDDFSGLLSLRYALTDTGLMALGNDINGEAKTKLLPNCRGVADRLR